MGTPERLDLEEKAKTAVEGGGGLPAQSRRGAQQQIHLHAQPAVRRSRSRKSTAIAKEGDYDLIIKDQTPDPDVNNRTDAVLQLGQRVVLYAKPEYDLTSAVIKRLNDKYAGRAEEKRDRAQFPETAASASQGEVAGERTSMYPGPARGDQRRRAVLRSAGATALPPRAGRQRHRFRPRGPAGPAADSRP